MAMFFPYFELAASIFMLLLAFTIFNRHYASRSARFFARMAFAASMTALFEYSMRMAFSMDAAREINRISSILWVLTFSMFPHFCMIFTKKDKWLKNNLTYYILYAPVFILGSIFLFTNYMYSYYEIRNIGIVNAPSVWFSLFGLHTLLYVSFGIYLLFSYAKKAQQKTVREQSLVMAVGTLIPLVVAGITDELCPIIYGTRPFWPIAIFGLTFMCFSAYVAMRRYSLFSISPGLAAEVVIETMPDSLIITDLEGRIILLNEEAHKFFHVPKEEILGQPIEKLFCDRQKYLKLFCEVVDKNLEIERYEAALCDPLGEKIPAVINANKIRDAIGSTLGIVYIIRDVRG